MIRGTERDRTVFDGLGGYDRGGSDRGGDRGSYGSSHLGVQMNGVISWKDKLGGRLDCGAIEHGAEINRWDSIERGNGIK